MAEPIETLYIELQGRLDGLERSLKQAEQRLAKAGQEGGEAFSKGFGSGIEQVITKVGSIGAIIAGGAIGLGAFDGLVRSVFSLAQEADRARTQAELLGATLERNGISAAAAEASFRKTADALGVLPQQLNESSKLLINYGATLDQVAKLQEIGGASALAAGRSAADGADLIAQAITTENSALLNGIGIASNLSTAYQNYGKEVGKTVEQLTAQEKTQAAVNYLLKETQSEVEALPTLLGGLAGQQQELTNRFEEFRLAVGEQLIPTVTGLLKVFNTLLDNLPTIASAAATLAGIIGAQRLAGSFAVLNLSVTQGIGALANWAATTVTTTSVTTFLTGALNTLRAFFLTSPAIIIAAGAALIQFAAQASSAIKAAEEAALASDQAFNKAESSRIKTLRTSTNEVDQLKGRIASLQAALSSIQLGELGGDAEKVAAQIKTLRQELATLQAEQAKQNTAQKSSNDLFREARTLVENLQKAQDSLSARQIFAAQQAIEAFTKANKDGAAVLSAVRSAIAAQTAEIKENEKVTKTAAKTLSEWQQYLKAEQLEIYRRSLENLSEAQLRTEVANQRSAQAVDKLKAATDALNAIQERRIQIEKELAASQANAPIQNTIARLAQQYDLANISLQEYLAAINRYLQVYSQQLAATAKGTDEYERLRQVILKLRDVQRDLTTELEVQADTQAKLAQAAPLTATINALAQQYKDGAISAKDYGVALEALIVTFAQQRNAFANSSVEYQRLDTVIRGLRETQQSLAPAINAASVASSNLQRAASDLARQLRILDESGQTDIFADIGKQYTAFLSVLQRGDIGKEGRAAAEELRKALTNVPLSDGIRAEILRVIKDFDEMVKKAEEAAKDVEELSFDIETGEVRLELTGLIKVFQDTSDEVENLNKLAEDKILSSEELANRFAVERNILEGLIPLIEEQARQLLESGASATELAQAFDLLKNTRTVLNGIIDGANKLTVAIDELDNVTVPTIESFERYGQIVKDLEGDLTIVEQLFKLQAISVDDLRNAYNGQVETLSLYVGSLENLAQRLQDSGISGEELLKVLQAIGDTKARIDALTVSIGSLQQGIRPAEQFRAGERDLAATTNSIGNQIGELISILQAPQVTDAARQLAEGLRDTLDLADIPSGLRALANVLLGEFDRLSSSLADAARSFDVSIPTGNLDNVNTILEDINANLETSRGLYNQSAINLAELTDTYNGQVSVLRDLLALFESQLAAAQESNAGSTELARILERIGATKGLIDDATQALARLGATAEVSGDALLAFRLAPAVELLDFKDALDGINRSLVTAAERLRLGQISGEEFRAAQDDTITILDEFVRATLDQADALREAGKAGTDAYSDLISLANKASEQVAKINREIVSTEQSANALRILKEAALEFTDAVLDAGNALEIQRLLDFPPTAAIDFADALTNIIDTLEIAGNSFRAGKIDTEDYLQTQLNAIGLLEAFTVAAEDSAAALAEIGKGGTKEYVNLSKAAESARVAIVEINRAIVASSQSVNALLILDKAAEQFTETIIDASNALKIQELLTLPVPETIDFEDALRGIGDAVDVARTKLEGQIITFEDFVAIQQTAIGSLEEYIDAANEQIVALESTGKAGTKAYSDLVRSTAQARDQIDAINKSLFDSERSANALRIIDEAALGFADTLTVVNDALLAQRFALPPEIFDYADGLRGITDSLELAGIAFRAGEIDIEYYNAAQDDAIQLLDEFIVAAGDQANLLKLSGQAGTAAYTSLVRSIQDARDQIAAINRDIVTNNQTVNALRINQESTESWTVSLEDLSYAIRQSQDAFEAGFAVPEIYQNVGNAITEVAARLNQMQQAQQLNIITSEELAATYESQLPLLEELLGSLRDQATALKDNEERAGEYQSALDRVGQLSALIESLNQQLVKIVPSAGALRIGQEATEEWGGSLENLIIISRLLQDEFESLFNVPDIYVNIGNAIDEVILSSDNLRAALRNQLISGEDLVANYENQLTILDDLRQALLAQSATLLASGENAQGLKDSLAALDRVTTVVTNLNREILKINPSAQSFRIGQEATESWTESLEDLTYGIRQSQDAFDAFFAVPQVYQLIGTAVEDTVQKINNLRGALQNQLVTSDELIAGYENQLVILEDLRQALLTQSSILLKNGDDAQGLEQALAALGKVTTIVTELNREIVNINPSAQSLRVAQESTESWVGSLEDLSYGIRQTQDAFEASFGVTDQYLEIGDAIIALRDQFGVLDSQLRRGTVSTSEYVGGVQSLIDLFGDLQQSLLQQGDALNTAGNAAAALERYRLAEEVSKQINALTDSLQKLEEVSARKLAPEIQVVDLEAGIAGIVEQTNALDAAFQRTGDDIVGTADAIRNNINILEGWVALRRQELEVLDRQGNRGSEEYVRTSASVQRAQTELTRLQGILDGYNRSITELQTLNLPAEFNVLSGAINDSKQQLAALGTALSTGTITQEEYRDAVFELTNQLESLVNQLIEQRDSLDSVDEAGQNAYGNLTEVIQQAAGALTIATEALRANVAAAIEAGRALRILQETSNEDIVRQTREGLKRLEELLSSGAITDEVLSLSDELQQLGQQNLPDDVRRWLDDLMVALEEVRQFAIDAAASTYEYENANRSLANGIAQTVDALRRSGEQIVTLEDALNAFKKYKIEVDPTQLEELRLFLFLTRTEFEDFVDASRAAARDLPQIELINFTDGLSNIGDKLKELQTNFEQTGTGQDEYRQGLIDAIGDLEVFIRVVSELGRQFAASGEESQRAIGGELIALVDQARKRIDELQGSLFRLEVGFNKVDDGVESFDRFDRTLARLQQKDFIPDDEFIKLLAAANIDFTNFEQLARYLEQIPQPLRGTGALFQELLQLSELSADAAERLAIASGTALTENQKLADEIRKLVSNLKEVGAISDETAQAYLNQADAVGALQKKIDDTQATLETRFDPGVGFDIAKKLLNDFNAEFEILRGNLTRGIINSDDFRASVALLSARIEENVEFLRQQGDELLASGEAAQALERYRLADEAAERINNLRKAVEELDATIDPAKFAPPATILEFANSIKSIVDQTVALDQAFQRTGQGIFDTADAIAVNIDLLRQWVRTRQEELATIEAKSGRESADYQELAGSVRTAEQALQQLNGLLEVYRREIEIIQTLDLPAEFNVLTGALSDVRQQIASVSSDLQSGALSNAEYEQTIGAIIDQLQGLVEELTLQRDAIDIVDDASQRTWSSLNSILLTTTALLNQTTDELQTAANAAINTARALRILEETGNDDVTQRVREGLIQLREELSRPGEENQITEKVNEIANSLTELAALGLPPSLQQWFDSVMAELEALRQESAKATEEFYQFEVAQAQIGDGLLATINALRRSGVEINSLQQALDAFKQFNIEVDSTQLQKLRDLLYLTQTDFEDFVELSNELAQQLPPAPLTDFSSALEGIGTNIAKLRDELVQGTTSSEDYQQSLVDVISELEVFTGVVEQLSRQYAASAEEADRAIGAKLGDLVQKARLRIEGLSGELFRLQNNLEQVTDGVESFDRTVRDLARTALPDVISDEVFRRILAASEIDFSNFDELRKFLSAIPEPLKGAGALFERFSDLVSLSAAAEEKLAEAAGTALSQNEKLAQQIRTLVAELVQIEAISADVADRYYAQADALAALKEEAKETQKVLQSGFDYNVGFEVAQQSIEELYGELGILESRFRFAQIGGQEFSDQSLQLAERLQDVAAYLKDQGDELLKVGRAAEAFDRYKLADEAIGRVQQLTKSLDNLNKSVDAESFAPPRIAILEFEEGVRGIVAQVVALDAAFRANGEDIEGVADAIQTNIGLLRDWVNTREQELAIVEAKSGRESADYQTLSKSIATARDALSQYTTLLEGYRKTIERLQQIDLPAEFDVLTSALKESQQQLEAVTAELAAGTIGANEYQQTIVAIINQLEALAQGLEEQRDAIDVVDEASQRTWSGLNTILLTTTALLQRTTTELQAAASAAINTARALRILEETGNDDATQQVREGLLRLQNLLKDNVITDEINDIANQITELAQPGLPPALRQWFDEIMGQLDNLRRDTNRATEEFYQFEVANKQLSDGLLQTINALRRSGVQINSVQQALDAFKVYNIEINSDDLQRLRDLLYLSQTDFEDFTELANQLALQLPRAPIADFANALEGIGEGLGTLRDQFTATGAGQAEFEAGIIQTVADLQVYIGTLRQLSQQYANSAEEADRAFGAQLIDLVRKAENQVAQLNGELLRLQPKAEIVNDITLGFDRLERRLAAVAAPDILPDTELRNLITATDLDFNNFEQLAVFLARIPEPLRGVGNIFADLVSLTTLAAQAQTKLAEAAGYGLTENEKLANEIRVLVQDLVVLGVISADVAVTYLEQAAAVSALKQETKEARSVFAALAGIEFTNFQELQILLERATATMKDGEDSASLLQQALRAAVEAEQDLGTAVDSNTNSFRNQADNIRNYTARLAATGNVSATVIQRLTDLSNALDVRAVAEDAANAFKKLEESAKPAKDIFAAFAQLNIPGAEGVLSIAEGITKLIGGDVLGGIQKILAPYADLLEPVLRPLGRAFGVLLDVMNPLISSLGELLTTVVVPLVRVLATALLPVFQTLGSVIKTISEGIKYIFQGTINLYNATAGKIFGQIGDFADDSGLIQRIQDVIGKIDEATRESILTMARNVQETLSSSFASALSDGLLEAISTGDLDTAKKALEERLRKIVVQVIIDTAVKAALATAAVSEVLKNLSDAIAYAIATGDWSGVGEAITSAISTVTGIMQQLSNVLSPILTGLVPPPSQRPGTPGSPNNPINPFGIQQIPVSPNISVPLLDSANLINAGGTQISDASTALVEGLQSLELDSVASDMARSSRDFRAAVDDLGALLTNRTNWAGVNSR